MSHAKSFCPRCSASVRPAADGRCPLCAETLRSGAEGESAIATAPTPEESGPPLPAQLVGAIVLLSMTLVLRVLAAVGGSMVSAASALVLFVCLALIASGHRSGRNGATFVAVGSIVSAFFFIGSTRTRGLHDSVPVAIAIVNACASIGAVWLLWSAPATARFER